MRIGVRNTYIPNHIRLTAALHFYATGSFLRDIGEDFVCPMSKSTLCLVIKEVTFIIQDKLMQKYIRFPTSADEQNIVKQRFFNATGFPGVIGAVDCTHIKIKKPHIEVEHCYRNRKGYFSKDVQLICDFDLKILGCYARYGGSTHDAFIWENSAIKKFLEVNHRQNNDSIWLLGDSGYPLQPWLMTPFRNSENAS
ncbi:putative nuclease HARBI1 [Teleopsis dalmanni]|uniref:putative nuclease HARBI1 n=1 Tax=Teleopsis dalmanni TaxID=139649 RepID=UPI0018CCAC9A|nr:putative nuclease HARBI1 [Teleopsis dalmanni]XP_037936875.1 putative nuclease HARBI1 [Teleopsis dalmanni]